MNFNEISNEDRVWIFPASMEIQNSVQSNLLSDLKAFLNQWKAHGKELKSFLEILENRFIIIAVDESFEKASGCSIDAMVHFIQNIERKYDLNLTDRSLVFYKKDTGEVDQVVFNRISDLISQGEIRPETDIFNTHVSNGDMLKKNWILKAEDSWIQRFFRKTAV